MNKQELKKIIKPLIKECLSEILLQEGLNSLVSSKKEIVEEEIEEKRPIIEQKKKKLDFSKIFDQKTIEKNKKLGFDPSRGGFNPFENTIPENELAARPTKQDIQVSNMINESAGGWNKILNAMNGKKDR